MTDRWTAETEELLARLLPGVPSRCPDPHCGDSTWDHDCQLGPDKPNVKLSRAVLTALADAGLLLPPRGETRQEWGYRYRGFRREWTPVQPSTRELAERDARDFLEVFAKAGGEAEVVRRVVHEGPWVAVNET